MIIRVQEGTLEAVVRNSIWHKTDGRAALGILIARVSKTAELSSGELDDFSRKKRRQMEYEFLFDGKEATEIYNDSSRTTKPSAQHTKELWNT